MRENIMKERRMGKVSLFFKMDHFMMGNLKWMIYMDMDNIIGLMEDNMSEIGSIIKCGV